MSILNDLDLCAFFSETTKKELAGDVDFLSTVEVISKKKGEYIFHQGERSRGLMILLSGVVRNYSIGADGREYSDTLIFKPGMFVRGSSCLFSEVHTFCQAITDVRIMKIPGSHIYDLLKRHNSLSVDIISIIEKHILEWKQLAYVRSNLSVAKRYEWYLTTHPELERNSISDNIIASYLGTTPPTLCRIKKQNLKDSFT